MVLLKHIIQELEISKQAENGFYKLKVIWMLGGSSSVSIQQTTEQFDNVLLNNCI